MFLVVGRVSVCKGIMEEEGRTVEDEDYKEYFKVFCDGECESYEETM